MAGVASGILRVLIPASIIGALAMGLTELLVRALGIAPPLPNQYAMYVRDPVLTHRPLPYSELRGQAVSGEFEFHYQHNSLGLRDVEHTLEKPPGTFRILGLGDSFTYGAGADFEATYLSRLEEKLNSREGSRSRIEVIRSGIPRFFPESERAFLEHYGLAFHPDLVLVGFVPNDVIDTYLGWEAIQVTDDGRLVSNYGARLLEQLGPGVRWIYETSHAARIPIRWILQKQLANDRPVSLAAIFEEEGAHEEDWREVERQYAKMVALARGAGAEIAFVHLPMRPPWDERHAYPAKRLARWAEVAGVAFIDVLPAMRRADDGAGLYWPKDGHPTDLGHEVIAEAVFQGLVDQHLVP